MEYRSEHMKEAFEHGMDNIDAMLQSIAINRAMLLMPLDGEDRDKYMKFLDDFFADRGAKYFKKYAEMSKMELLLSATVNLMEGLSDDEISEKIDEMTAKIEGHE